MNCVYVRTEGLITLHWPCGLPACLCPYLRRLMATIMMLRHGTLTCRATRLQMRSLSMDCIHENVLILSEWLTWSVMGCPRCPAARAWSVMGSQCCPTLDSPLVQISGSVRGCSGYFPVTGCRRCRAQGCRSFSVASESLPPAHVHASMFNKHHVCFYHLLSEYRHILPSGAHMQRKS